MNIDGRLGSVLGIVLMAGFLVLILRRVPELPLIVICIGVMAMLVWNAIEEEWRGGRQD